MVIEWLAPSKRHIQVTDGLDYAIEKSNLGIFFLQYKVEKSSTIWITDKIYGYLARLHQPWILNTEGTGWTHVRGGNIVVRPLDCLEM